jgi:hypothetical protein
MPCVDCKKETKGSFIRCYECNKTNKESKTILCVRCNKLIKDNGFTKCYECNKETKNKIIDQPLEH